MATQSTNFVSYWVPFVDVGNGRLAAPTQGIGAQSPWDFCTLVANVVNPNSSRLSPGALQPGTTSYVLPGATSIGIKLRNNYKHAKSQNHDAETLTDTGRNLYALDVVVKFTGIAAFQQWQQCVDGLGFKATGTVRPVYSILHPKAQEYGIQFVVLEELEDPPEEANKEKLVRMRMTEWRQPVANKTAPPVTSATIAATRRGTGPPTTTVSGLTAPPPVPTP